VREPKSKKPKVGKAVPVADSQGRKGGLVGSPPRGEPTRPAGQRDGVADDAGNVVGQHLDKGVLRQPEQLEQVSVRPGDPFRPRKSRPNFITAQPYEPKSSGFTLLRHRHSRAVKAIEDGKVKRAEIGLPIEATTEMIAKMDNQKKWAKLVLESIEDFEAIMLNPDWLIPDKAKQIEMIVGTMHSRATNFKNTLE
jgi:hypothetical protein